jgi:hypothetical protein
MRLPEAYYHTDPKLRKKDSREATAAEQSYVFEKKNVFNSCVKFRQTVVPNTQCRPIMAPPAFKIDPIPMHSFNNSQASTMKEYPIYTVEM